MFLQILWKSVVFLLVFNMLSCVLAGWIIPRSREVIIETIREPETDEAVYLIGGCQCRTVHPFDFCLDDIPEYVGIYLVEYQNSGFDVKTAGEQLKQHIREHAEKATLVSISMGYQLSCIAAADAEKEIALNPCIGRAGLTPGMQRATSWLWLAHLGTFVMGWAKYLPVVKVSSGQSYSLALLVDQFDACASNAVIERYPVAPEVVVFSTEDTVIDETATLRMVTPGIVPGGPEIWHVETGHFGTSDNSALYREAVRTNLPI